jgi:hypothetical protein
MMNQKLEWSCGHVAGSMCAECYSELAGKANKLAAENILLREIIDRLHQIIELVERERAP